MCKPTNYTRKPHLKNNCVGVWQSQTLSLRICLSTDWWNDIWWFVCGWWYKVICIFSWNVCELGLDVKNSVFNFVDRVDEPCRVCSAPNMRLDNPVYSSTQLEFWNYTMHDSYPVENNVLNVFCLVFSEFRSDIIMKVSSALICRDKRSRQQITIKASEHR